MLSSTVGDFRDPDDYESAMQSNGYSCFVVTQHGPFRARLTEIALHHLRLQSANESSARVALVTAPPDDVIISVPVGRLIPPAWAGIETTSDHIVTVSPGHRTHSRLVIGGRWGTIVVPAQLLASHSKALTGTEIALPDGVCVWRPSLNASRHLTRLHMSATGIAKARAGLLTTFEPARGLENDVLDAVVDCLTEGETRPDADTLRNDNAMSRLEDALAACADRAWTAEALASELALPVRLLEICCEAHLGVSATAYIGLRRRQVARGPHRHARSIPV